MMRSALLLVVALLSGIDRLRLKKLWKHEALRRVLS